MSRSRATEVEATEVATNEETAPAGPTHIKYVGAGSKRIITSADWASLGIEGKEDSVWGFHNDYHIPVDKFDEDQLAYLRKDGRFQGSTPESSE